MATIYINADTGNDTTGDGSEGSPWLTMGKAHTEAASGDTVICQDSTAAFTWAALTFAKDLTIQGESNDASGAVFDGASGTNFWKIEANTVTIEKCTFTDNNAAFGSGLFMCSSGSGTLTMTNCVVHNVATSNNQRQGIWFAFTAGGTFTVTLTAVTLYDVTTFNQGDNGIISQGNGTMTATMTNCTFAFGSGSVPKILDSGSTLTATNCIFSHDSSATWVTAPTLTYCCEYNISDAAGGTGNITTDPLYVDEASANFNLRPTSPCINTGTLT